MDFTSHAEGLSELRAYERPWEQILAEQRARYGPAPQNGDIGEDLQYVADSRNIDFSYVALKGVFKNQYRQYYCGPMREKEFVECHANQLLETMIAHYGVGNGGGRKRR